MISVLLLWQEGLIANIKLHFFKLFVRVWIGDTYSLVNPTVQIATIQINEVSMDTQ